MGTGLVVVAVFLVLFGMMAWLVTRHVRKQGREIDAERKAAFEKGYADLLPDFHPANVMDYVLAEYGRPIPRPAFAARRAGDYSFQKTAIGGELRVGTGLFEINLQDPSVLRLRYADKDREYLWARLLAQGEHIQWTRGPNAGQGNRSPER